MSQISYQMKAKISGHTIFKHYINFVRQVSCPAMFSPVNPSAKFSSCFLVNPLHNSGIGYALSERMKEHGKCDLHTSYNFELNFTLTGKVALTLPHVWSSETKLFKTLPTVYYRPSRIYGVYLRCHWGFPKGQRRVHSCP